MSGSFRFGNVSGPVNAGSGNMNVGSGTQYNAGRDLHVGDRVGYRVADDPTVAAELATLREALEDMRLTARERQEVADELDALAEAADTDTAAGHLESFVSKVQQAGALASAGSSVAEAVTKLARWLGPAAAAAVGML